MKDWIPGLGLAALCLAAHSAHAAPDRPDWKIVTTKYPTTDRVVAGFNVLDFGAKGDGRSDCTRAFQKALDRMKAAGGGTVFVPEGRYAFAGNLQIPVSVTLRGEWSAPTSKNAMVKGTVLMPFAGRGDVNGEPFITVDVCAGIKDLNIWYPKQSASQPVPYPFCLIQKGGDNATFENLTLVNPWQGIRIGPGSNELHMVRNVYGSPLKTGIRYDSTTDIGRLETISFAPLWWCRSGLPGAPRTLNWVKNNGTAIHMLRSDWEYVGNVRIDGYQCGFRISQGVRGAANAQFYHLIIRNCGTAMEVEKTNPYGMVFTECYFDGSAHGVLVDEKFDSAILFSTCIFTGNEAIRSKGTGKILMEQCRILGGNVTLEKGAHSIHNSAFEHDESRIRIGKAVEGIVLAGNRSHGRRSIVQSQAPDGTIQSSSERPPLSPVPDYPEHLASGPARVRAALKVVNPSGKNDTAAIQGSMDALAREGGGIVFLPGGDYRIEGHLNVPSGIELRGIHDVPHHTMGGGSILQVFPPDDEPTLTLEAGSGLRGLSFNHPEQQLPKIRPYPFLIQGRGSNIHLININAANPFKFIDLMTHRCDRHHVDYASGSPLMTGIAIGGGSQNGIVRNMQFNPHYWSRAPRNPFFANKPRGGIHDEHGKLLWEFQKENLDALVLGDCSGEFLYQNFVFGSLYGIHFTRQSGAGAVNCISHGHGTDGSKVGVYFEHGNGTITMVNTELVAMSSMDKTAIKLGPGFDSKATLINSMVWGKPDLLAEIENGTLALQNLHAHRHGRGLHLIKGKLNAFNLSFNQSSHHLSATRSANTQLSGFITNGPFHASEGAPKPLHLIERKKP